MKYLFSTEIKCGEKTCKSESGSYCQYFRENKAVAPYECLLFNAHIGLNEERIPSRCYECKKSVVETKEIYNINVDCGDYKRTIEVADAIFSVNKRSALSDSVLDAAKQAYDIPKHNRQDPPVYKKHMESVGLTVRRFGDYVYVFRADGKVWLYDEVEWSYGASGQLMVNHTPIHRGIVPPVLMGNQE